jgi:putative membrane-bound dehydrogenase-like protein
MLRFALATLTLTLWSLPAFAQKEFGFDNTKSSGQPYLTPQETVARMKPAEGFEVKLFAGEPQLVNPIAMTVDERGRVWVVECFEYPKRTAKGKMPRDRVKILEDTDGDGVCDKVTTFIEGKDFPVPFDLASGIEVGNGGVYLGAPPYLFFIENKNDKPGKIDILLKGFGSEDTHEMLNTFQWGPDGRLYGLHGVFTHSDVTPTQADGPSTRMNAAVWRYDTKTKKFEIFSEGTSNPWGMDWRNTDGQFILCCCVIPHLFHMVPGGNYKRQAGQSFNPYTYGEIKEICDHTFHKESGWAHAGLVSLDTPIMPEKYRNSVVFGSIHGCSLKQNILKPNGSSYIASRGDDFLVSGDKNFRPINLRWGPNGEIYCVDWHDQNPCHQTKPDDWDYERGRVYRIQTKGLKTAKAEDIGKRDPRGLVELINDPNPYRARTALRLLLEKKEGTLEGIEISRERKIYDDSLWSLKSPILAVPELWKKSDIEFGDLSQLYIRYMAENRANEDVNEVVKCFVIAAAKKTTPSIRRELASAAIRLQPQTDVRPLVRELLKHKEDAADPMIPQLLWAVYEKGLTSKESKAQEELNWLKENAAGNALISDTIVPRTLRRLVATGKPEDLAACLAFLGEVKDSAVRVKALEAVVSAIGNRTIDGPENWKTVRDSLASDPNPTVKNLANSLAIKFRDVEAVKRAQQIALDNSKLPLERLNAIRDLGAARSPSSLSGLLNLVQTKGDDTLRLEAARALAGFDAPELSKQLLARYSEFPQTLKSEVVQVLSVRKDWAADLLAAVAAQKVDRRDLNDNTILRIQALKDKNLLATIEKVWGRMRATPAELTQIIDKMRGELASAPGSFDRGKLVFDNQCAKCHKFDGRGSEVGPSIEGAGRDIEYLLANVLDPNRVIGSPYFIRTVNLLSGRVESGVLQAEDDQSITLKTENAVLKQIFKKDIEDIRIQEKSLMPEGLGNNMTVQDFRDLVRYVMANPFIQQAELSTEKGKTTLLAGVNGRFALPAQSGKVNIELTATVIAPNDLKARLQVGSRNDYQITVNDQDKVAGKGSNSNAQPDQSGADVSLKTGVNTIKLTTSYDGKTEALFLRFLDPDRKLRYADGVQK